MPVLGVETSCDYLNLAHKFYLASSMHTVVETIICIKYD
jgi:hypothetical protein